MVSELERLIQRTRISIESKIDDPLKFQRMPLDIKEEPVVGSIQLERHDQLDDAYRKKSSWLFGKVTP